MSIIRLFQQYGVESDIGYKIIEKIPETLTDNKQLISNSRKQRLEHNIKEKYNKVRINDLTYYSQIINLVNLNIIYINEELFIKNKNMPTYNHGENDNKLIDNIILSYLTGEDIFINFKDGKFGLSDKKNLFKNFYNNIGTLKFFNVSNIIKSIIPEELKKEIKNYKKNKSKELKKEIEDINKINLTIDKFKLLDHKNEALGFYINQYQDDIKEILKKKGITDEKTIEEYAKNLNEGLYKLAGLSGIYKTYF